jgi:predicted kinase
VELEPLFWQRFDAGCFRECHGDLHLGNLVRLADGITTFDCIEFNPDLRNIDVIADIAFLIMDLVARKKLDLAAHFLNRYLEFSGDYDGMRVFNLYFTYRCLVRAKIAVIRSLERTEDKDTRRDVDEARSYCEMARRQIVARSLVLLAMYGLSGSGKTWVSDKLMSALPAIRVRSDLERKRLSGLDETADSGSGIAAGIYTQDMNVKLYTRLNETAAMLLSSGHNVILDAAYLNAGQRAAAHETAADAGASFILVHTVADEAVLRSRIQSRQTERADASEASTDVLDYQLQNDEGLTDGEVRHAVCVASATLNVADLVERVNARIAATE